MLMGSFFFQFALLFSLVESLLFSLFFFLLSSAGDLTVECVLLSPPIFLLAMIAFRPFADDPVYESGYLFSQAATWPIFFLYSRWI